ncbi:MAG: DUF4012 domain-containing protein [Dehalococcoidia bacterium]
MSGPRPAVLRRLQAIPHGRGVLLAVAVLALLLVADGTRRAIAIRSDLVEAKAALDRSRATLTPLLAFEASAWPDRAGYDALLVDVTLASERMESARGRLGYLRYLLYAAGLVPVVGEQAAAAPRTLDLGADISAHAASLMRIGEPLFAGSGRVAERARTVLVVRAAEMDADLAALERSGVEARRLAGVRWMGPAARAQGLLAALADDLSQVGEVRQFTQAAATGLDPLLGFGGGRRYVVMGQNEQEIRPTGGFMGTMGVIEVADGRLGSSEYRSSYDFDPPGGQTGRVAPPSLNEMMGARQWVLRDANWDAHFPTSAERTLVFLEQDQRIRADGAVAVNTPMIQRLLRATGPLQVEGFDEPLTADGFISQLEEEIFGQSGDTNLRKRQLLQPVLRLLISRVQEADGSALPALLGALTEGIRSRDLQVYMRDPAAQALVARLGADGALEPVPGHDFLAVVDGNISFNKIQIAIRRDIVYLARSDGWVDVRITWTNERSTFTGTRYARLGKGGEIYEPSLRGTLPAEGTFGNYVRIYVPANSTFDSMSGFTRPPGLRQVGGLSELGGLVTVPDGKSVSVRLSYRPGGAGAPIPEGVVFWKQGGQTRDTLRVGVARGDQQATPFDGPFTEDLRIPYERPQTR